MTNQKRKDYFIKLKIDELCYLLSVEGIKGLGKEHEHAGFLLSNKSKIAIDKFILLQKYHKEHNNPYLDIKVLKK